MEGGGPPRKNQSRGRLLPDVLADADLVRAEHRAAICHRDAPRTLVWLDHRFVGQGSVLYFADHHGGVHVARFEDDAHDEHRSAAADDDEDHAGHHGRTVHDLADFQRFGSVYFNQQLGRHHSAVVAESFASATCASESAARQERQEQEAISNKLYRNNRLTELIFLLKAPWPKN